MSDFFHPMTAQISNKIHQCAACFYAIEKGAVYRKQSGVFDGSRFTNKYHPECWDALIEDHDFEFTPGDGDPPEGARPYREAIAASLISQMRDAQRVVAGWTPEKRALVVLEGQDIYRDRKVRRGEPL